MTILEAVNLSLRTLKEVMEEKLNSTNVEVMIMTPERLFQMYTKEEVQKIIEDLQWTWKGYLFFGFVRRSFFIIKLMVKFKIGCISRTWVRNLVEEDILWTTGISFLFHLIWSAMLWIPSSPWNQFRKASTIFNQGMGRFKQEIFWQFVWLPVTI